MASEGLTRRQQRFVEEYLVDLNGSAAYQRAGYSARGNAAEVNAAKLLRNTQVQKIIAAAMAERSLRTEVTADRVLKELARLAFFDIGEAFNNEDGSLKPLHMISEDVRRAIAGFEVTEIRDAEGNVIGHTKKVKFADKIGALEKVMKHLGMFSPVRVKFDDPLSVLITQVQGSAFKPMGREHLYGEQGTLESLESAAERALREAGATGASFMSIIPGARTDDDDE